MKLALLILFTYSTSLLAAEPVSSEDARARAYDEPSVRHEDGESRKIRYGTHTPDKRQPVNETHVVPEIPVFVEVEEKRKRHDEEYPRHKLPSGQPRN